MTDPKRWSEADEASDLERELVRAGQAARMPESERRALWAGIALALPLTGPPAGVAPAPLAAASRWSAYLTKGLIFAAAVTGLTVAASQLWPHATRPAPISEPRSTSAVPPTTLAVPSEPAVTTPPGPTPVTQALQTPPGDARALPSNSQLREESVAVLEARAALRAGDAARSLRLLEQARLRFPRGALGQEREALTIQALAQVGQRASARQRADAFLRAHPRSPYVADVRLLATP